MCGKVGHFQKSAGKSQKSSKSRSSGKGRKTKRSNTHAVEQEEVREGQQQEDGFDFPVDGDSSKSGVVSLTVGRVGLHDILIDICI